MSTGSRYLGRMFAALATTIGLFTAAGSAAALDYRTCDGVPVIWGSDPVMHINTYSFPAGGARYDAVVDEMYQWNNIRGMEDILDFGSDVYSGSLGLNDGSNRISLVTQEYLGTGVIGRTFTVFDDNCGAFTGDQYIVEADVVTVNTLNYSEPTSKYPVAMGTNFDITGRGILLHELGHAFGLALSGQSGTDHHSVNFSVMRAAQPSPLAGGADDVIHVVPMPIDAHFGRFLYPYGSATERQLFTSTGRLDGGSILAATPDWQPTYAACRGDVVRPSASTYFYWTVANTGHYQETFNTRLYISTSADGFGLTGTQIAKWSGTTVNAENQVTTPFTVTVPCGTAPGTYRLYVKADSDGAVAETWENDNVSKFGLLIDVNNCGCN